MEIFRLVLKAEVCFDYFEIDIIDPSLPRTLSLLFLELLLLTSVGYFEKYCFSENRSLFRIDCCMLLPIAELLLENSTVP